MENVHSRPIQLLPSELRQITQPTRPHEDVLQYGHHEVAPSIYNDINGYSYLAHQLGLKQDDEATQSVNGYILERMRLDRLEDKPETYKTVIKELYKDLGLHKLTDLKAGIESIYHHFFSNQLSEKDYLILSILAQQAKQHARPRR